MKAFKNIGKLIIDILTVVVIISAILIAIIILTTNKDGVPDIMGYSPFSIQSNSMEPTLKKGDLIIDKIVDIESLKVGDIISFYDTIDGVEVIKTHRITNITTDQGFYLFNTKGDNNSLPDATLISDVDVIGKYDGKRVPYLGSIIDFLKSKFGFLFCIILPLSVLFITQLVEFIKKILEYKMEETKN